MAHEDPLKPKSTQGVKPFFVQPVVVMRGFASAIGIDGPAMPTCKEILITRLFLNVGFQGIHYKSFAGLHIGTDL